MAHIRRQRKWQPHCIGSSVKLLICFILALTSLTANTGSSRLGTAGHTPSRDGSTAGRRERRIKVWTNRSSRSPKVAAAARRCEACIRDAQGRIARSPAVRREFQRENPCPSTGLTTGSCPGYIADHITALKRGGLDEPDNMQWQTRGDAKAKDRIE